MKIVAIKDGQKQSEYSYDPQMNSHRDVWVGRGEDCQIVIRDPKVSRLIGRFHWKNSQLFFITESQPQATIQLWPGVPFIWQGIQFFIENMPAQNSKLSLSDEGELGKTKIVPIQEQKSLSIDNYSNPIEDELPLDTPLMLQETINPSFSNEGSAAKDLHNQSQLEATAQFQLAPVDDAAMNDSEHDLAQVRIGNNELHGRNEENDSTKTEFIPQFLQYVLKCEGKGIPYEHFFLDKEHILIGSGPKCLFKVNDVTFPLIAAELKREGGIYSITSLDNSVELVVNGKVVNKAMLNDGLRFKIGNLTFDVVVQSEILHQENEALMPVEVDDQETAVNYNSHIQSESKDDKNDKQDKKRKYNFSLKEIWQNPKRRMMLYVIVIGLVVVFLEEDPSEVVPGAEEDKKAENSKEVRTTEKTDFSKQDTNTSDSKDKDKKVAKSKSQDDLNGEPVKQLTAEEKDYVNSHYQLSVSYIEKGDYLSAINEIDLVRSVDDKYKDIQLLSNLAKDGLKKIEEEEKRKKELEEKLIREAKVKEIVAKAQDALRNDELIVAENLIGMVIEIDPENQDVHNLKQEIEARKEDLRLKEEQKRLKEDRRSRLVEQLLPGKGYFIQKEWFKAIMKINEFLNIKDSDEDLITEASEMLAQANKEISLEVDPLLLAARSAKSKEDLKEAYENYVKILKINPGHDEAVTETKELKEVLNDRARKIFREAMYKESINLYIKAREKFQEVLLVAPSDSEYYLRAEARLKKLYVD